MKVHPLPLSVTRLRPARNRLPEGPRQAPRSPAEVLSFPLQAARLARETRALIAEANVEAARSHRLDPKRLFDLLV